MKTYRIQWLGVAAVAGALISVSTASCEDPSIWSLETTMGLIPAECQADSDCNDEIDCTEDTCSETGLCKHRLLPTVDACNDDNLCTIDVCNSAGICQHILDKTLTATSETICKRYICISGEEDLADAPDGYPCELKDVSSGSGYCYQTKCVSCADGVKNGTETDIDCGGENCPSCNDGQLCNQDDDCTHGHCTDGVCCNTACDKVCYSCALPASKGTCSPVSLEQPDFNPDPYPKCSFPNLCDGMGSCKATLGKPCGSAEECLSGYCYVGTGTCQIDNGQPCNGVPIDCYTNNCDPNSGQCSFIAIGNVCAFNDQCGPGNICSNFESPHRCRIAENSKCFGIHSDCVTNYCNPTFMCAKAPDWYMCKNNDQCASTKCVGNLCTP